MAHFPPGTSKWNKVEPAVRLHHHELAGRPLISHQVVIETIAATTTKTGLKVRAMLDTSTYRRASRSPIRRCGHRGPPPAPPRLPWRLELHRDGRIHDRPSVITTPRYARD